MISFLRFAIRNLNQQVNSSGGLGGQCVDLVNQYLAECYGAPHVYLNAVDWQHVHLPGWRWVLNTPVNFPPPEAIVVWGANVALAIGTDGHLAINVDADPNYILSFDQNWAGQQYAHYVMHDYQGVIGWHIPPSH